MPATNHITEEELLQLERTFPFSNYVQFELLKLYHDTKDPKFDSQASKAALFFPDVNRLRLQLSEEQEAPADQFISAPLQAEPKNEIVSPPLAITPPVATPSAVENEPLAFEPLHTVDYFLSQGIKITDEAMTNDKLGRQLKSFTQWLKTMKKIHPEKQGQPDEQVDRSIQSLAETSNNKEDVATEALAEVLLKQGKTAQAAGIYEKLSLQNPSKKAYFAAKIQSIKER
jgi:hypothetical protein